MQPFCIRRVYLELKLLLFWISSDFLSFVFSRKGNSVSVEQTSMSIQLARWPVNNRHSPFVLCPSYIARYTVQTSISIQLERWPVNNRHSPFVLCPSYIARYTVQTSISIQLERWPVNNRHSPLYSAHPISHDILYKPPCLSSWRDDQ